MNPFLFNMPILPEGFKFPDQYLRLVKDNALPNIEPWVFLFQNIGASLYYYGAMLQKFPDAPLVPFAVVNDQSGLYNGGWVVLASFDGRDKSGSPRVCIYTTQGQRNYCMIQATTISQNG